MRESPHINVSFASKSSITSEEETFTKCSRLLHIVCENVSLNIPKYSCHSKKKQKKKTLIGWLFLILNITANKLMAITREVTSQAKVTYCSAQGTHGKAHVEPPCTHYGFGECSSSVCLSCLPIPWEGWHPSTELRLTLQKGQEEAGRALTSMIGRAGHLTCFPGYQDGEEKPWPHRAFMRELTGAGRGSYGVPASHGISEILFNPLKIKF